MPDWIMDNTDGLVNSAVLSEQSTGHRRMSSSQFLDSQGYTKLKRTKITLLSMIKILFLPPGNK